MKALKDWFTKGSRVKEIQAELERREILFAEVDKARKEWEYAYLQFQEAQGKDEVDVAVYTLEAAERRYQIQLKEAKRTGLVWGPILQIPKVTSLPVADNGEKGELKG